MKYQNIMFVVLAALACTKNDRTASESNLSQKANAVPCKAIRPFNREDSSGITTGRVNDFLDTSQSMSHGLLQLVNDVGDTIMFYFDYDEAKKIEPFRLKPGACVEVAYYAEIQRVEVDSSEDGKLGDEISRHFYVSEIKYLN